MTAARRADVWRGDALAGTLSRTRSGAVFEYDQAFVASAPAGESGIALHLPYARRRIETRGTNLHTFFAGLLPEGIRLRALVRRVKTSEDDLLSLLVAAGADCVGDVSVVPTGERPAPPIASVDRADVAKVSFAEILRESLGRASEPTVPGVQEKISAAMISLPLRGAYILKLNPVAGSAAGGTARTPKEAPRLVENERFFMAMAAACGIDTADVELVHDRDGAAGLLVARFDREGDKKLHQEDACQILDRYPADKYALSTGELFRALDACDAPIVARARLLRVVAFSYAIGNGDLHGKNVSLYVRDRRTELTPAYDLLSTLPYGDTHMALKLDAKDDNLGRAAFVAFGDRHGVRRAAVTAMLDELVERARPFLPRLGEIGFDARKTKHLERSIAKRLADLAG